MNTIKITSNDAGKRIDKFLVAYYGLPFSLVMRAFRSKDVKVNGKREKDHTYKLQEGDVIVTYFKEVAKKEVKVIFRMKTFGMIYQDENIMIVDKPNGLIMDSPTQDNLKDQVLTYLDKKKLIKKNTSFEPANIHRLDKGTSGCVVFALNYPTLRTLQSIITDKDKVRKEYIAVVEGKLRNKITINKPLIKDEEKQRMMVNRDGKPAITHVAPIIDMNNRTLVEIVIETGRKHQIRAHLAAIGHPVVGDRKYGKRGGELALVAKSITFTNLEGKLAYLNDRTFAAKNPEHINL